MQLQENKKVRLQNCGACFPFPKSWWCPTGFPLALWAGSAPSLQGRSTGAAPDLAQEVWEQQEAVGAGDGLQTCPGKEQLHREMGAAVGMKLVIL